MISVSKLIHRKLSCCMHLIRIYSKRSNVTRMKDHSKLYNIHIQVVPLKRKISTLTTFANCVYALFFFFCLYYYNHENISAEKKSLLLPIFLVAFFLSTSSHSSNKSKREKIKNFDIFYT